MTDKPQETQTSQKEVRILPPDTSLKEKIGVDLERIFTPGKIRQAEIAIKSNEEEFLATTNKDIQKLRTLLQKYEEGEARQYGDKLADEIRNISINIKGVSGIFGYQLASATANSLFLFCEDMKEVNEESVSIIVTHVDALMAIFRENIRGHGGTLGRELTEQLQQLVRHYRESH